MRPDGKRRFSVTLTKTFSEALDKLIEEGLYIDNQGAIRHALRRLFRYHGMKMNPFHLWEKEETT